jgi:hypothetical protein
MCSTCGDKTYGQDQTDARKKDVAKLEKVRAKMAKTSENKLKS